MSQFWNSCKFEPRFPVFGNSGGSSNLADRVSRGFLFAVAWRSYKTCLQHPFMTRACCGRTFCKIVLSRWLRTHRKRHPTNGRSFSDRWAEVNAQVQLNIRNLCIHTLLACPHKVVGRGGAGPGLGAHLGKQILFMDMNNWAYVRISLSHVLMEVRMNISEY